MKIVEEFRRNAKDCRALAMQMPERQRQQLIDMAAQWEQLAKEREITLAKATPPES